MRDKVWNHLKEQTLDLDERAAEIIFNALNSGERDTLIAAVYKGPLWAGDLPSKAGRDALVEAGMMVPVMFKGGEGFYAATYFGGRVTKYGEK